MKKLYSISEYIEIVERYHNKGCYTNDYLQNEANTLIKQGKLFSVCKEKNALLLVKQVVGLRIYYYINDFTEMFDDLPSENMIIEILFRGVDSLPQDEIHYWETSGFKTNIMRCQYSAIFKNLNIVHKNIDGLELYLTSDKKEISYAINLFNNSFDKYTSNYISLSEYDDFLENHRIIIAKYKGRYAGAMHYRLEGKTVWAEHNVVEEWCRGQHIGTEICNFFLEVAKDSDNTRYTRWTKHNGQAAHMYEKLGFKYTNKSTISLLKLK